jgi:glucosylceramidase
MALSRKLTALSALALLAPLACADLIGLRPPKPDESGSGGLGGDGNQGTGASANGNGGTESGGAGPDAGGGTSTGSASATGGNGTGGNGTGGSGTGGNGTGGNGTGGEPPIPDPTLITSGPGSYWVVDEVVEGGTTADVTVNVTQQFQTWLGFGGTFSERAWEVALELSTEDRDDALQQLFGPQGLRFNWGRIPIGANDYARDRYTLNEAVDNFDMSSFSIERDEEHILPFVQAALDANPEMRFWGSAWTPPTWMKTNTAYDGGVMRDEEAFLQAFADYLVAWVEAYEAEGVPIDHVQPQNEPEWELNVPSCAWGSSTQVSTTTDRPEFLGTFVEDYLLSTFGEHGLSADVWYGAFSSPTLFDEYWANLSGDARNQVGGVGVQWGALQHVPTIRADAPALLIMQTAHDCGNYPWAGGNLSFAPNDHAYAEETLSRMIEWITAGVNAYIFPHMILDDVGVGLDNVRIWPQNSLLVVQESSGALIWTPAYYAVRHLARYVDLGATRLGTSGGDALAFQNPDGTIVTVLYNSSGSDAPTTLDIDGTMLQFTIPGQGWATVNWQE